MRKKVILGALCFALLFLLCGCWNYVSLNDLSIVSAIAADMNPESGEFDVVFEVFSLSGDVKSSGPKSKLIQSKGKTLFDAARNAKRRLDKRLYFGNNQIFIISEELARSGHLMHMVDWFLRDAEHRETVHIIVSQEKTASEMLKVKGINNAIVGNEMENIVMNDQKVTSSTRSLLLYQVFDTLHTEGLSLTLPAIHKTINDEEVTSEVNGVAVFKSNKMLGYLSPEESKYFLFAIGEVEGGTLTLPAKEGEKDDVSLEISENKTKQSFSVIDGKLKITVDTETRVYLAETATKTNALDKETITSLEAAAGAKIKQEIENVIKKVQMEYRSDIFGFGNMIRKRDVKLWASVSNYWDDIFPTLDVTVNSKINIANSANIKDTDQEGAK